MSFTPYECLHVPVKAAQARVFGLPLWVLWLAVAAVAVKLYGPWLVLAPVLVILAILAAVIVLAAVRANTADPADTTAETRVDGSTGAPVDVLSGAPVVVLSSTGSLPCMGCGTDPATSVLEVSGYRIPVCGPCRGMAETRITVMVAAGVLRALE
jgi:hypothetical protein